VEVELAGASGGEDDGVGVNRAGMACGVNDFEAGDDAVVQDEVEGEGVLEDGDVGGSDGVDQGQLDGEAGGVASGVEDAGFGVSGFEASSKIAGGGLVEADAEPDEVADALGAFGAEDADGFGIAKAGSGGEGVGDVAGGGVVGEHDGGDAALCPAGVGVGELGLGDEGYGVLAAQLQGCDETGDAGAYDQNVFRLRHRQPRLVSRGGRLSMVLSARRAGTATDSGTVMRLRTSPRSKASRTQAR
jgi:hypothetical protein